MVVQFLAAALLTPAYTAGAISDEKERKTLEFILATDLRNREIVLSKLASRLANLLLFLLTGLPILSFLQLLGGVDPGLVLAGFAATGLTVLSLASLSMLSSVLSRRSRDAIIISYLGAVAYLGISGLSRTLLLSQFGLADLPSTESWTSPVTVRDLVEWLCAGNPFVAVYHIFGGGGGPGLTRPDEVLPEVLRNYAIFHLLVAGVCATLAVVRLRPVALKQTYDKQQKGSLLGRWRLRPAVGDFPMVWKEVLAEPGFRLHWLGWALVGLLVLGSLSPTGFIVAEYIQEVNQPSGPRSGFSWDEYMNPRRRLAREMNSVQVRFVGTCVACFLLLAVAVRAAGSITGERERQTLGSLLTTPLGSDAILFGKWLGSILSVRLAWLWLGTITFLGLVTGGLHVLALPGLLLAWAVYAAFLATLGLWFSTVCRTTLRAVLSTVFSAVGLSFGHWLIWACCIPLMWTGARRSEFDWLEWVAKAQFGLTPPMALGWLAFYGPEFEKISYWGPNGPVRGGIDETSVHFTIFSILGMAFWAAATCVLWGATSRRLRVATGRTALRRPERWLRQGPRRPVVREVLEVLPASPPPVAEANEPSTPEGRVAPED